ncbi:MAG: phosphoglycerate dehydrogenase [Chloroflexota bacterium]|nr:phosphoglycerate dehydrogenase [Chloroflexota bacterium]
MYQILVAASLSKASLQLLEDDPEVEFEVCKPPLPVPARTCAPVPDRVQAGTGDRVQVDEKAQGFLAACDAIIVSSQVTVDEQLLEGAPHLKVIGRAGTGLDNIDVEAASRRGVLVMNVPGGNTIAAAEHTMALILALCRNIPQAQASLKRGEWRRGDFLGVQLYDKVLGIIGLGRIGSLVARRAQGFRMTVVAYDPHISVEAARDLQVTLLEWEELLRRADFITLHAPLTPSTRGLISAQDIAQMKPGVRIVNAARGALIDPTALYEALTSGHVAGAALDVFDTEPPEGNPLLSLPNVIATPHLGSKTEEARRGVSIQIVNQVLDALRGRDYQNAVNMPLAGSFSFQELRPYLSLAERIGSMQMQLAQGRMSRVEVEYRGPEVSKLVKPLTTALLKGLLTPIVGQDQVNYVNAPLLANQRGVIVAQVKGLPGPDYPNLISCHLITDSGERLIAGTLFSRKLPRIVQIDEYRMDALPEGIMLVMASQDVPGVIGKVGAFLGQHNINIAEWRLGRNQPGDRALSVINLDNEVPDQVMEELAELSEVIDIRQVVL